MTGATTRWRLILSVVAIIVTGALLVLVVAEMPMGCTQARVFDTNTMEDRLECE
ncbi:MAG: hypothetical protein M9895_06475 [Aquamicrobium sp.]|uniref:hypothetical protein n=1 Tax=Aquamicrobium sp. TaxID=1872579 RepID=UPI00349EF9AF|nr:hypothetical protein [Aquamicrobium sp.]MCO5158232.1 hypothetical protein [Aquamicrobium sp.]